MGVESSVTARKPNKNKGENKKSPAVGDGEKRRILQDVRGWFIGFLRNAGWDIAARV